MKVDFKNIHTITIKLPWWLRWAARFIKLDHKIYKLGELAGQKVDFIIMDEVITHGK